MGSSIPIVRSRVAGVPGNATTTLVPAILSTTTFAKAEQFAAWRDFMAPVIDLAIEQTPSDGFAAEQTVWDLGSLVLSHSVMPTEGQVRTWRHLKRDPLDHWCLVLVGGDEGMTLSMRSLARPFEGASRDREVICLYVPRDLFRSSAATLDGVPPGRLDGPLAALLADYIASLHRRIPTIAASELPKLVEATRTLLAACLQPAMDTVAEAQNVITVSLFDRARRIIQQNLGAPNFGPPQLCRMLGVSRSRLYRMFEPLGGVSRYVQRQRLLAAHHALADQLDTAHIAELAERVGFVDASGFSRAFRQEFGYSPRQARAAASLGTAQPTVRPAGLSTDALGLTGTSVLGVALRRLSA